MHALINLNRMSLLQCLRFPMFWLLRLLWPPFRHVSYSLFWKIQCHPGAWDGIELMDGNQFFQFIKNYSPKNVSKKHAVKSGIFLFPARSGKTVEPLAMMILFF